MTTTMTGREPLPGTAAIVNQVTAVLPRPGRATRPGLHRATLTDLQGSRLCTAWLPSGAYIATRGARVFMHYRGDEWRQVPVVHLAPNGQPQ